MNKSITLEQIVVDGATVRYKYTVSNELRKYFTTDTMFLHYEQDMTDVPLSILAIPFVNCMAGLSWLLDAMLLVDEIDETYYYAFKQIKLAYAELHSTSLHGIFIPSVIKKNKMEGNNKHLLLFGGGVDCHSSFLRNIERVSGIVNIYGWARREDEVSAVDKSDKEMTLAFAHQFGIEGFHVTSNFASQFDLDRIQKELFSGMGTSYWYGFLHSMAFLSIAAPIAWQKGCANLMIASSFTKKLIDVHCGSFITTDNEFKFSTNGNTMHDGFELNRQQKIALIAKYQLENGRPYLIQSCSFNDHNCCSCEKCFRTVVELIAEGVNPRDFGFIDIDGSMVSHWKTVISRDIAQWAVQKEGYYYYNLARKRMIENYESIADKEFVDWFLSFDFDKAKRDGLRRYYFHNFFSILKRKMHM